MADQIEFGTNDFAQNPEQRCPCVLLLDTSGSMAGEPIAELNAGLVTYRDELAADALAAKRVDVAIVTFGPVRTVQEFATAESFHPPTLTASGDTPMGEAINHGIDLVTTRKQTYKANAIDYYRPWIFLITAGGPTDPWQLAADRIRQGEAAKSFAFFGVGVKDARMDLLGQICRREPLTLNGLPFRDLFRWLSDLQKAVSRSQPGDAVPLTNPATPGGWATV